MFARPSFLHFSVILESKVITNKIFFYFLQMQITTIGCCGSSINKINKKVIHWFARRLYTNKPLLKRKGYFSKITGFL